MTPQPDQRLELLRGMLRIRRVQERIESLYLQDEMKTPVHLYIGQEAIAVGVCAHLGAEDYIQSNHRSHGHYLAKGGDLKALIAELHCRSTGCSKGFGGSMHVVDTSVGHLGSSSIVGGGIPIATGLGLAAAMQGQDRVSVAFFGDGAADEGVLYESVNFAMLKRLPVVYVLENNQWSVCSHVSTRHACDNVFHKGAPPELLYTAIVDGNDVEAVWQTAAKAVERARSGQGPSFIECRTYRILGHAGCKAQDPPGYRNQDDVCTWQEQCPVKAYTELLLSLGDLAPEDLVAMDRAIAEEIDEAFAFALASPLPGPDDLHKHVFRE
ncbi:MAG: thiamine pyrophosphate-dependent dehydrogenase E1 component subunit alpha [Thermodesulfobacteriota bacterium]